MIVTSKLAIGHIPRTGGDAAHQIFTALKAQGFPCEVDSTGDRAKHSPFNKRPETACSHCVGTEFVRDAETWTCPECHGSGYKKLVLILRRLPSWYVSWIEFVCVHGVHGSNGPLPRPTMDDVLDPASRWGRQWDGEVLCPLACQADNFLRLFADGGRLKIDRWLRMENLRLGIWKMLVEWEGLKLSYGTNRAVFHTETKGRMAYDHTVSNHFDRDQMMRLYANNPLWAELEREVYR